MNVKSTKKQYISGVLNLRKG